MPYPNVWCPKLLMEYLSSQSTFAPDTFTRNEIGRLLNVLELHRPTGNDGKHGELHTPTCGCEDKDVQPHNFTGLREWGIRPTLDKRCVRCGVPRGDHPPMVYGPVEVRSDV